MWHVYLIIKYHCVRENTAYSKDFIRAIYGIIKLITYSYITAVPIEAFPKVLISSFANVEEFIR